MQGQFNRERKGRDLRTNRVEADAIVAEIRAHFADPARSGYSVGVVTFNSQQRDLVLNLLEETDDPVIAAQLSAETEEGLFVKNLENVQGDERDVILFSAAFSRKPDGSPLPLNFGPLSRQGGEKRLNVAVTRARRKVVMFTSFDPTDIDLGRTTSRGLADLRAYIEMAARPAESGQRARRESLRNDIGASITRALEERGLVVETDFGLSEFALDLVVRERDAEFWQVAVVLDGPGWAARPTASDRDLMPRLLTELMSWGATCRVWLPEWLDAPDAVLDRIQSAIADARIRADALKAAREAEVSARAAELERQRMEAGEGATVPGVEGELEASPLVTSGSEEASEPTLASGPDHQTESGDRDGVSTRAAALASAVGLPVRDFEALSSSYLEEPSIPLGIRSDLDRTNSHEIRQRIAEATRATVEREGPIEVGRLARQIAARFGFDRVPAARSEFILSLVPPSQIRTTDLGSFVWPTQVSPDSWRGHRATPEGVKRPLGEVAPEEIINAMAAVVGSRHIAGKEELFRETLACVPPEEAHLQECRSPRCMPSSRAQA